MNPKRLNILGQRYGRLVAIERVGSRNGASVFLCLCDCGNKKEILLKSIRSGATRSCGCYMSEVHKAQNITHGERVNGIRSTEYSIWSTMLCRCRNKKDRAFVYYGGRGISVCQRWESFENFLSDMGRRPSPKHSIERNNNNGNYEPGNCRWATRIDQNNNTSRNRILSINGESKTIAEWARIYQIPYKRLSHRIHIGMDASLAVSIPRQTGFKRSFVTYQTIP